MAISFNCSVAPIVLIVKCKRVFQGKEASLMLVKFETSRDAEKSIANHFRWFFRLRQESARGQKADVKFHV